MYSHVNMFRVRVTSSCDIRVFLTVIRFQKPHKCRPELRIEMKPNVPEWNSPDMFYCYRLWLSGLWRRMTFLVVTEDPIRSLSAPSPPVKTWNIRNVAVNIKLLLLLLLLRGRVYYSLTIASLNDNPFFTNFRLFCPHSQCFQVILNTIQPS